MTYIPKNQIKANLFTSGNEFVTVPDYVTYSGPYWKKSTGQKYTGRTPSDGPNRRLIPISREVSDNPQEDPLILPERVPGPTTFVYDNITLNRYRPIRKPMTSFTKPNVKNYQNGFFYRYFTKQRNQNTLYEISSGDYDLLNKNTNEVNNTLYRGIRVRWAISNKKREDIFLINQNIVQNLENSRNFYGLTQFFNDKFDEYYSDKIGIIYINGKRSYVNMKPVPEKLPPAYQWGNKNTNIENQNVPPTQNCNNCILRRGNQCTKWNAEINKSYWCKAFQKSNLIESNTSQNYSTTDQPVLHTTGFQNNSTNPNNAQVTNTNTSQQSSVSISSNYSSTGGGY